MSAVGVRATTLTDGDAVRSLQEKPMPENAALELEVQDITDASWEDLVQTMMQDELDAVTIQAGTICNCDTTPNCSSCNGPVC
jgi:hypothetical protein